MLDQFQPKTEGSEEERDASPSTTKARRDLVHVLEEQHLEDKLLSFATDMGGDTLVKEINSKKGIMGSQPRGYHNVFTTIAGKMITDIRGAEFFSN